MEKVGFNGCSVWLTNFCLLGGCRMLMLGFHFKQLRLRCFKCFKKEEVEILWFEHKQNIFIQYSTQQIDKMTCSERLPKCNNFALSLMRIFRDWNEKNNFLAFNRLNNGMGRINAQLTIKLPVKLGQINTIVKYSHWGPYLCSACLIVLLCLLLCFIKKNLYPIVEDNRN